MLILSISDAVKVGISIPLTAMVAMGLPMGWMNPSTDDFRNFITSTSCLKPTTGSQNNIVF
jgi:hypothetical protein